MVETVYCVHCGAVAKHPVTKAIDGKSLSFCCGGCLQVYEMLHEEGLESGQGISEAGNPHPSVKPSADSALSQTVTYHVAGMTCANCVATVERRLRSVPGVMEVRVILATERATVKMIPNEVSLADLKHAVEKAGYGLSPEVDA